MLLSRKEILGYIDSGKLVRDMIDKKIQLQQCGVDLTAGRVFSLSGKGVLDFTNGKRKICNYKEVMPEKGAWTLQKGVYHIAMNETIALPNNVAGLVLPRSSALACGFEVHSAVWDPGYKGRSFIHCSVQRSIELHKNARIAQIIFFRMEETDSYSGKYKGEDILKFTRRGA